MKRRQQHQLHFLSRGGAIPTLSLSSLEPRAPAWTGWLRGEVTGKSKVLPVGHISYLRTPPHTPMHYFHY